MHRSDPTTSTHRRAAIVVLMLALIVLGGIDLYLYRITGLPILGML